MGLEVKDYIQIVIFAIAIGGVLITIGGLIYSLREVIKDVEEVKAQNQHLKDKLSLHMGDAAIHVNHLHMAALKESITELKSGHKDINAKLDRIVEKLYEAKK